MRISGKINALNGNKNKLNIFHGGKKMLNDMIEKWKLEYETYKIINNMIAKVIKLFIEDLEKLKKTSAKTINLFGDEL
jgi:hypothetical protein